MNVLILGNGGREHSLAWRIAKDPSVARIAVAPGNPGIQDDELECIDIDPSDPQAVLEVAQGAFDLVVIGPEAPLVAGVADILREHSISVFGPNQDGSKLEGSKAWMKDLLVQAGVPTAKHQTFHIGENEKAYRYLESQHAPFIVKTDGLAAGKGVLVTDDINQAKNAVDEYLSGIAFGQAGTTCVIEEGMTGPEISLFAICDGKDATCIGVAQDHKRVGDGDSGPNTGGMGAYSPVPFVDDSLIKEIMDTCIAPTLSTLQSRGIDYRGVLYAGLMLTKEGPKIVEYNIRFGDPECQILMMRLTGDLALTLKACADGTLFQTLMSTDRHEQLGLSDYCAITVVLSAKGYPEKPQFGDVISGINEANRVAGVKVFHAGTKKVNGELVTNSGRVLNVTVIANDIQTARDRAYEACSAIKFEGMHYRKDIAYQAIVQKDAI